MPLPDSIRDAPELDFGLELFLGVFWDLTTCRSYGMGEGPIPYREIVDYCLFHEIEGELQDDVLYHVRKLDYEYLTHKAEKSKT